MNSREVLVSISLEARTIRVGRFWFQQKGSRESSAFEYDSAWLTNSEKFALEPALKLTTGSFHTAQDIGLFGAIGDSAPDRWGRVIMRRYHNLLSKEKNSTPASLSEIDYLLGVNDETRQGALRFSVKPSADVFLANSKSFSIPPLIALPRLLNAAEKFSADEENADDLRLLLAPGSSLGGARPKASVMEADGSLAIAKFPRTDDSHNIVSWEAVALALAKKAGITVPSFRLEKVNDKPVLIIKRFDRVANTRVPFLSAMSMLGARDNEQHSYLELVYALVQYGAQPLHDIKELWRRIVFSIMVANTDDHLRNHGFLYQKQQGWCLAPAYDINPTPLEISSRVLTTAIDYTDHTASLENAIKVCEEFRIKPAEADAIINEVGKAVKEWRVVAKTFGLTKSDCDLMSSAFKTY